MSNKKWIAAMLGAAAMALSTGALAQQGVQGWYVGADVGQAEVADEDDIGFRILGGYNFNRNLAAEVGYAQLLDKNGVEATAMELVAIGSFPLASQFSAFGKVGFANVEVEAGGVSDDKTELTFGLGVQYDVSRNLGLRAQWQRYDTDEEVDVMSIGFVWKF